MKLFLLLVSILGLSNGYKILGIFPLNGKSHMVMFESLMKGLALKGHEVDVYSAFPMKKPIPGYNDHTITGIYGQDLVNSLPMDVVMKNFISSFDLIDFIFGTMGTELCKSFLNTTIAEKLKNTDKKYDLLVTEIFGTDCMVAFGHHLQIPVVSMMSSVNLPWASDRIGNVDNPSYIPNYFTPYTTEMGLFQKIYNFLSLQFFKYKHDSATARSNEYIRNFFGPNVPDLRSLVYNTSLVLVNSHLSINFARPMVPNFIEVGGIHIQKPQALPKHLEEAVDVGSKYKGVIYFSMGSMVMTETIEITKLQGMFDALSKLPYKVIWKANKDKIPKEAIVPSNVEFHLWLPQIDVLCHPNVKLFISHGGLMGTQEGIYCGVPMLGIPLFADQRLNLRQVGNLGMSVMVEYNDISKDTILEAAKTLLFDTNYADKAHSTSKMFKDRPLSALESAIYWVEYVIRYNGAPHLRSRGSDLPLYQYCLLDVALALLVLSAIVVYACNFIIRKLLSLFLGTKAKKD